MTEKNHTAELAELAADMPQLIHALGCEIVDVAARMATLEKAGLIYATEHWRKDAKGEPKYLYLLFPQKAGEDRRRDYVGCDPEGVGIARAGIERARQYDALAGRYAALTERVRVVAGALHEARRCLVAEQ